MSKKIDTLKALLAKAAPNSGSTEAEMMTALEAAMKLSKKWGLSLEDIQNSAPDSENYVHTDGQFSADRMGYLGLVDKFLCRSLQLYCCVKMYRTVESRTDTAPISVVRFFGHESDVDLALYIRHHVMVTAEQEWTRWKYIQKMTRQKVRDFAAAKYDFYKGFCEKVTEKMDLYMRPDRDDAGGTALVLAKNELMERKWKDLGINLHASGAGGFHASHGNARAAGQDAGGRFEFGRGVSRGTNLIGRQ